MLDHLTDELARPLGRGEGTEGVRVRDARRLLQLELLLQLAGRRLTTRAGIMPGFRAPAACALVPPRARRRPAPARARPLGRRRAGQRGGDASPRAAPAARRHPTASTRSWRSSARGRRRSEQALELLAASGVLVGGAALRSGRERPRARGRVRRGAGGGRRAARGGDGRRRREAAAGADRAAAPRGRASARCACSGWDEAAASTSPSSRRARRDAAAPRAGTAPRSRAAIRWLPLRPFDGLVASRRAARRSRRVVLLRVPAPPARGPRSTTAPILRRIEATPPAAPATAPLELAHGRGRGAQLALRWLGGADLALPGVLHVLETRPRSRSARTRCSAFPAARPAPPWSVSRRRCRGTRPRRHDRASLAATPPRAPSRPTPGSCGASRSASRRRREPRFFQASCEVGTEAGLLGVPLDHLSGIGGRGPDARPRRPPRRSARRSSATRPPMSRTSGSCVAPARDLPGRASRPSGSRSSRTRSSRRPGFPFRPFTADTRIAWVEGASSPSGAPAFLPAELVYLGRGRARRAADRLRDEQRARLRRDALEDALSARCSSSSSATRS